jgi:hypothetical protein
LDGRYKSSLSSTASIAFGTDDAILLLLFGSFPDNQKAAAPPSARARKTPSTAASTTKAPRSTVKSRATASAAAASTLPTPAPSAPTASRTSSSSAPKASGSSNVEVHCDCGELAGQRTVTKESINKGRRFWTCETRKCQFFEWEDGSSTAGAGSGGDSNSSRMKPPSTIPTKRNYSTASVSGTYLFLRSAMFTYDRSGISRTA